jgi:hypothetical protein
MLVFLRKGLIAAVTCEQRQLIGGRSDKCESRSSNPQASIYRLQPYLPSGNLGLRGRGIRMCRLAFAERSSPTCARRLRRASPYEDGAENILDPSCS